MWITNESAQHSILLPQFFSTNSRPFPLTFWHSGI